MIVIFHPSGVRSMRARRGRIPIGPFTQKVMNISTEGTFGLLSDSFWT